MIHYLEDVLTDLINTAQNLQIENEFERGVLFGYYEIINKMLNQAEAFGLAYELSKDIREFNTEELIK